MPHKEFVRQLAYEQISPGDPERSDLRMAMLICKLERIHGNKKAKVQDYMLDFNAMKKEMDDEKVARQNQAALMAMFGGKIVTKKREDGERRICR